MENRFEQLPEWLKGYVAGLMDGEGCLDIQKETTKAGKIWWYARIRIGLCNKIVYQLQEKLETGAIDISPTKCKTPFYSLRISQEIDVYYLLKAIGKYLFVKRKQANLLMEFCELKFTHMITENDSKRFHDEISALND